MSWISRPQTKGKNPAAKFLEWKSDEGKLSYYDKEKGENILVELPLKFVILEHYHTVKGWHDASESGIYSNEVFEIGRKVLNVRSLKGGGIAQGLYKEIKSTVKDAGGHYCRSIYAVTNDLEIINISLKGSGVSAYSDFIQEIGDGNFDTNWVEITEAAPMKKGKVSYTVPVFKKGAEIKDKSKLQPFAETLESYMNDYFRQDFKQEFDSKKNEDDGLEF